MDFSIVLLTICAKKDINEGTKLSFSEFFSAAELLYGTFFMVLCHVFFIPGEPHESCTQKHCKILRDSKMLKLKVIFQQRPQVKWQKFQPRAD